MRRIAPHELLKLALALLALLASLTGAGAAWAADARPHIQPRLVAESATPTAGSVVPLALVMKTEPGWHGYWRNPGDAGVATRIAWRLPAGVSAGPLRYPLPRRLLIAGLMNYVYEGDHTLLTELRVPAGLKAGTPLPIRAHMRWLACTDRICVPEQGDVALDLTVGDGAVTPTARAAFDRYRAALPRPLGSPAAFQIAGDRMRLAIPLPASVALADPYFYPLTDGAFDYGAPQSASRNGDTLVIEGKAGRPASPLSRMEGVIGIGDGTALAVTATPGAVPAAGTPVASESSAKGGMAAILLALGGAILGGLILNGMPCVFPILSLKALSLARAGGEEKAARHEALAYTGGTIAVCLALGLVLLLLRAGGSAAGWAFQLQDARVILLLLLLVSAIALNLAGLFELPMLAGGQALAGKGGAGGAFWTGALAAFVATPCTGPFMGAALGAALILPPTAALAVFGGLGLGLALPFLALGFLPALRRRLPRPGPWMERLRHILALPMLATALWLAWVLGRLAGVDAMTLGVGACLLLGLALWRIGARQGRGGAHARLWWPLVPALAVAAACIAFLPTASPPASASATAPSGEEAFSEARLAALRQEGRPIFVYFTADWCLTCKVNEKTAIQRAEVADAFARRKVAVLVGDWTRGDPAIGRFLASQGRSGVPLYLYYAPGKPPVTLPQILTPAMLMGLGG